MSKIVECPKCHEHFQVRTRARLGSGTQKGKLMGSPNKNKQALLGILKDNRGAWFSVRQIQGILYSKNIKRWQRGDIAAASGAWNYHTVQVDLSLLVGAKLIKMFVGEEDHWSESQQRYLSRPVPKYSYGDWP